MTSPQLQRLNRQENFETMLFRKDFFIKDDDEVRKVIYETLLKFTKEIQGSVIFKYLNLFQRCIIHTYIYSPHNVIFYFTMQHSL